jgi:hypothetical protein
LAIVAAFVGVWANHRALERGESIQKDTDQRIEAIQNRQDELGKNEHREHREEWHDRHSGEDGIRNDLQELTKKPGKRTFTARLGDDLNVDEGVQSAPPKDASPSPATSHSPQSPTHGR